MRSPPLLAAVLVALAPALASADPFVLNDGDRVVWIGSTIVEREQQSGYWESVLTTRFPSANIQHRNLGWSGDTVWGDARAGFGTRADGTKHLREHVLALKPTVIVVGYGSVESFEGEAGLSTFKKGMNELLDALAPTKARLVFLQPPKMEKNPLTNTFDEDANENLISYGFAVREIASARGGRAVNLARVINPWGKKPPLTVNGQTLSPYGYWRSASYVRQALELPVPRWRVEIKADDGDGKVVSAVGTSATMAGKLSFRCTDSQLPTPPVPDDAPPEVVRAQNERVLVATGLQPGRYRVAIDGQDVAEGTAEQFSEGVGIEKGPEVGQAEKLRATIIEKNQLYFYRWRPQNETYLYGFRKHEQGKNAREIPLFDPLVEAKEAEIAKLRKPAEHTYTLTRLAEER